MLKREDAEEKQFRIAAAVTAHRFPGKTMKGERWILVSWMHDQLHTYFRIVMP